MKNNKLYDYLKKNDIDIDKDVFEYSMLAIKQYSIFLLLYLPASLYFGSFFSSIFFIILFVPLRKFMGGLHFKNKICCLVFSVIVALSIAYASYQIKIDNVHFLILAMSTLIIVTSALSPTDHYNKRISFQEKKVFKKKAIVTMVLYSFLLILFSYLNIDILVNLILLTSTLCILNNCVAKLVIYIEWTNI